MAAERTWMAWWRASLGATAGALAVGRFAPHLLNVAPWPYIVLSCGYASLAVGLLMVGAQRQRELERALRTGGQAPLRFRTVGLFTVGGIALAVMTIVLVLAQIGRRTPSPSRQFRNAGTLSHKGHVTTVRNAISHAVMTCSGTESWETQPAPWLIGSP
jgi:uncharacterized membrane protein YidH (DUF202 family)